jgi:hypothetical protein
MNVSIIVGRKRDARDKATRPVKEDFGLYKEEAVA